MVEPKLSAAFIDGVGPKWAPKRVLGCRLRKFSLWHSLILNTVGSPFVAEGLVDWRNLRIAVAICRLQFGDTRMRRPWLLPLCYHLRAILTAIAFWWTRGVKRAGDGKYERRGCLRRALEAEVLGFLAYAHDYLQKPDVAIIPRQSGGPPPPPRGHAPDEFEKAADLIGYGFTEKEAWNMPLGRVEWYRAYIWKTQGLDVDFDDEEERKFRDTLPPEFRWNTNGASRS